MEICSVCCAAIRDPSCGECVYYFEARKREMMKHPAGLRDGHFIAEISPEIDEAVNAGLGRAQRGDAAVVIRELEELLEAHPRSHTLCFGIGTAHAFLGRHREAIAWFDRAITIFPHCVEALVNRARAWQQLGDFSNTVRAHRKVLEYGDPHDPDVAQSREFLDEVTAMVNAEYGGISVDAFLKSSDDFAKAYECMERREWEMAATLFKAVLRVNPGSVPAHGNLGLCHAQLGRKADALAEIDKALELDPGYEPARINRRMVVKMVEGTPPPAADFVEISRVMDS